MNWTIKNTKNASVARNLGRISGTNVFTQPNWLKMMYCGTTTTWNGSMIVISMIAKNSVLNRNLQPGERVRGQRAGEQVAGNRPDHHDG